MGVPLVTDRPARLLNFQGLFKGAKSLPALLLLLLASCTGGPGITEQELAAEYFRIGRAYQDLEQTDLAVEYYGRALALDASLSRSDYNMARAWISAGNYERALEILEELQSQDPENLLVWKTRAYVQYLKGDGPRARELHEQALELSPADPDLWYNFGLLAFGEEDWEESRRAFTRYREIQGDEEEALALLARSWIRLVEQEPLELDNSNLPEPSGEELVSFAEEAEGISEETDGISEETVETVETGADGLPLAPEAPGQVSGAEPGDEAVEMESLAEAVHPYQEVLEAWRSLEPREEEVLRALGLWYQEQRVYDRLLEVWTALAEVLEAAEEPDPDFYFALARVHAREVGDQENAETFFNRAREQGFDNNEAVQELLADPDLIRREHWEEFFRPW